MPMAVAGLTVMKEKEFAWREMQAPPFSWADPQAGQMTILKEWRESKIAVSRGERRSRVAGQPYPLGLLGRLPPHVSLIF